MPEGMPKKITRGEGNLPFHSLYTLSSGDVGNASKNKLI